MTSKKKKRIRGSTEFAAPGIEAHSYLPAHARKIIGCMGTILEVHEDLMKSSQDDYSCLEKSAATYEPRDAVLQARCLFRKRMAENGHRLLANVITDLLQFMAIEAGVDGIDRLVYPGEYKSAETAGIRRDGR